MKAMIFAAGLGTRLRPLTDSIPKALVQIDGVPMLERIARRLVDAGASRLVINAHHFADKVVDFVVERQGFGVHTDVSLEAGLLETGGGVLNAERFLSGDGNFLIHNVDVLSNLDIRTFASSAREGALSTLAVSRRESSRHLLFDSDLRLVGRIDHRTGVVESPFGDIDPSRYTALAFGGIHLMSGKAFELMRSLGFEGRFPIMDFYLKAAASHPIYAYVQDGFRMMDMGKAESLPQAEAFARELDGHAFCD